MFPFVVIDGKGHMVQPNKQMSGEKIPGDLKNWDYFGTDPNTLLLWSYATLSQRATTLYHTHAPVAAAINKQTNYAIGSGLRFRSQPDGEILGWDKERAKEWGMRLQKLVHYMFLLLNFYEKQSVMFRTSLIQGDSLLMFDRGDQDSGLPFDLIETGGDQIDWSHSTENCTLGIFHDKYMRRTGIKRHDVKDRIPFRDNNNDQNVIQFYLKLMSRQLRGYPLAYRIIAAAKNNDRWWDATLARLVMETMIFAQTNESNEGDTERMLDTIAGTMYNETGGESNTLKRENITDGAPGAILSYTNKDGGMKFTDLKTPSNNFNKVQTAYIDIVGMATDTPPECIMSKYSTSFTAHKGALNDFKRSYEQKRGAYARNVCHVTLREIAKYLFMEQMIEMPPGFFENPIIQEAALKGLWLGPVPGHINPSQEVEALIKAKDNAFITPADAAAMFADAEWDDQIEEWQRQMEEWRAMSPDAQAAVLAEEQEREEAERDEEEDGQGGQDGQEEPDDEKEDEEQEDDE